jgi:hypothetical protein
MKDSFVPYLDILPPAQLAVWCSLNEIPRNFVLYGGTALALHLGHRESIDYDFFSDTHFDPDTLLELNLLRDVIVLQKDANTLTVRKDYYGESVMISFFGVPKLIRLRTPHLAKDNQLQIASLLDIAGTKAAVVQKRAESKDYIDIDALLAKSTLTLGHALAAGKAIYGDSFNPEVTLKALCYFGDEELTSLDDSIRHRLVKHVQAVNLDNLPDITKYRDD